MKKRDKSEKCRALLAIILATLMCANTAFLSSCGNLDSLFEDDETETDETEKTDKDNTEDDESSESDDTSEGEESTDDEDPTDNENPTDNGDSTDDEDPTDDQDDTGEGQDSNIEDDTNKDDTGKTDESTDNPIDDTDNEDTDNTNDVGGSETGEGSETNKGSETEPGDTASGTETNVDDEELIEVVRIKKGAFAGTCLSPENLEVVKVPASGVPEGAIRTIAEIVGKYTVVNVFLGEYVFDRMITDASPENEGFVEYVVVSDEIDNAPGKDITAELQALIDKHPGRTIYFSDGVYNISSPIKIEFNKEKAVSIRLSNYATIKALPTWDDSDAMIVVGGETDISVIDGAEVSIMGGIIDGSGVAKVGMSFENCEKPFVSDVTFKAFNISLWAKPTASSVNFESITVNGDKSDDSIGILIGSSGGVVSTSVISNVSVGVKSAGSYNDFRNILVYADPSVRTTCGFLESGNYNVFEMCTSQNFACGYLIKDATKSIFEACNSSWESAAVTNQTAFLAEGTFNSIISGCVARFFNASSNNAYIKITTKGSGIVKVPVFDEALCDDKAYKNVLSDTVVPIN